MDRKSGYQVELEETFSESDLRVFIHSKQNSHFSRQRSRQSILIGWRASGGAEGGARLRLIRLDSYKTMRSAHLCLEKCKPLSVLA